MTAAIIASSIAASLATVWGWWLRGWWNRRRPWVVIDGIGAAPVRSIKRDRIRLAENLRDVPSSSSTFYVEQRAPEHIRQEVAAGFVAALAELRGVITTEAQHRATHRIAARGRNLIDLVEGRGKDWR